MSDGAPMEETHIPTEYQPNVDDVLVDTGMDSSNIVFATIDNARTSVKRWIDEEIAYFNKKTGWDWEEDNSNWNNDYRLCVKKYVESRVKIRIFQRQSSMAIDAGDRGTALGLLTTAKDMAMELERALLKNDPEKPTFVYYSEVERGGEYLATTAQEYVDDLGDGA